MLMIKQRDLEPLTGYVHGGCSPLGMKKQLPTFIEETAQLLDAMIVSAGRVGVQVELSPDALAQMTGAKFTDLV
jgi:Cys-tRNA(Pro)/Cys-tRNA(Cys) deacylase